MFPEWLVDVMCVGSQRRVSVYSRVQYMWLEVNELKRAELAAASFKGSDVFPSTATPGYYGH